MSGYWHCLINGHDRDWAIAETGGPPRCPDCFMEVDWVELPPEADQSSAGDNVYEGADY